MHNDEHVIRSVLAQTEQKETCFLLMSTRVPVLRADISAAKKRAVGNTVLEFAFRLNDRCCGSKAVIAL